MGPVSLNWYEERGLDYNTQRYSAGRIDVRGTGLSPYGDEIGVPPMRSEDWSNLSAWLDNYTTDSMVTLQQIVNEYELNNPKIRWWKEK